MLLGTMDIGMTMNRRNEDVMLRVQLLLLPATLIILILFPLLPTIIEVLRW